MQGAAKALGWTLVVAAFAAAPAPALAAHVACGDAITQDTTLDSDLLDCPGNGVEIAADGVTLDLGGHLIDGSGRGLGVVAFAGSSDSVVTGGRLSGFLHAVALAGGTGKVVREIELTENHDGILVTGGDGALIERVVAWDNDGSGVNMPFARNALVRHNVMVGNAAAVSAFGMSDSRFEHNLFASSDFHGIRFAAVTGTVVAHNRLPANGAFGIRLEDGSVGNLLSRNHVTGGSGDGISLSEDSGANRLERNHSDRNGGLGFDAPLGVEFDLLNKARRNGDPRQCVGVDCGRP